MNIEQLFKEIKSHVEKAKAKHPVFAYGIGITPEEAKEKILSCQNNGTFTINEILTEEVYEFLYEIACGNVEKATDEACDIVAVLIRAIEFLEEKGKTNEDII